MKFIRILTLFISLISINSYGYNETNNNNKTAKRIIALAPHIVENLYAVGAGELIVGTTEHADFPEQANDIPRVGNYSRLNIEQILAVDPDVIIAWKSGNPSDDLAKLEQLGLNIKYSNPKNIEDVAAELVFLGDITGNVVEANKAAKAFLHKLKMLRQQYSSAKEVTVFFEMWSRPLTTVANNAWLQQQINVCNARNPFVESPTDYPQINVEQVVLTEPQIIIQPSSHSESAPNRINWQQWTNIPAVKNNAFIYPNADKLYRMTNRSLDELTILCQKIDALR